MLRLLTLPGRWRHSGTWVGRARSRHAAYKQPREDRCDRPCSPRSCPTWISSAANPSQPACCYAAESHSQYSLSQSANVWSYSNQERAQDISLGARPKAENGDEVFGVATPSAPARGSQGALWAPQRGSGRNSNRPKLFHYFQHSGWPLLNHNIVICGLSCSHWGQDPRGPLEYAPDNIMFIILHFSFHAWRMTSSREQHQEQHQDRE